MTEQKRKELWVIINGVLAAGGIMGLLFVVAMCGVSAIR